MVVNSIQFCLLGYHEIIGFKINFVQMIKKKTTWIWSIFSEMACSSLSVRDSMKLLLQYNIKKLKPDLFFRKLTKNIAQINWSIQKLIEMKRKKRNLDWVQVLLVKFSCPLIKISAKTLANMRLMQAALDLQPIMLIADLVLRPVRIISEAILHITPLWYHLTSSLICHHKCENRKAKERDDYQEHHK